MSVKASALPDALSLAVLLDRSAEPKKRNALFAVVSSRGGARLAD